MNEEAIRYMEMPELLRQENVFMIQAQPAEIREQLKAMYFARMQELQADKDLKEQVKRMFKTFDAAERDLANAYTKENARRHSDVSIAYDGKGQPLVTIDNFLSILRNDPKFASLRFNQLSYSPEHIVDGKIERWLDKDDSIARCYIEEKYKLHHEKKFDDALRIIFSEREYHPIKQIIESVEWDGKSRITSLFVKWLKCEDTPYTREVTRLVFAGGIHRLYDPGCKFDDVAVLIGTKQGEGKSTFARWLALKDEFFTEVNDFEGEKAMQALEGAWICEISELLALTKTKEVEAAKSFITRLNDRRKIPYDRRVTDHKRQCVFIGTTNRQAFLTDKSGNRRWYPVEVFSSGYDLHDNKDKIQADILQAWAEAKHLYDIGELNPYADRSLLATIREKQERAVEDDYRVGLIGDYVEDREKVCVLELWKFALDNPYTKPMRRESNEIALILQGLGGWVRGKVEHHATFGNQLFWVRSEPRKLPEVNDEDLPV